VRKRRSSRVTSLKASKVLNVYGVANGWSCSAEHGVRMTSCEVEFCIQGDGGRGFVFVMMPSGFFAADSWCASLEDALETGEDFGVPRSAWVPSKF